MDHLKEFQGRTLSRPEESTLREERRREEAPLASLDMAILQAEKPPTSESLNNQRATNCTTIAPLRAAFAPHHKLHLDILSLIFVYCVQGYSELPAMLAL